MDSELYKLAAEAGEALRRRGWMLAIAESCTGGWLGQAVTMVPGSSKWFDCGFVTYTNDAKHDLLGVRDETLAHFGAVSEQAVREMAQGALARSRARLAVAVSGVAGPDGGTPDKPVGTVWIAWALGEDVMALRFGFSGDRDAVRRQAVIAALSGIVERARG
ncbi:MAG TPA: nicotinamide-nucleotide amidohydrolase family protein [Burkholderiales bacterium]|nr:nicotinamide-nucleotide amidohydrolase family protein [Burkholderiales bacterium]